MPYSQFRSLTAKTWLTIGLASALPAVLAAQQETAPKSRASVLPPVIKQPSSPKAAAYYHFSLGHLYAEMAAAYGNRGDYLNKAIENFRLAMKEDPTADFLVEDIAELYLAAGRVRDAVEEAQNALKENPDQINAHRVLGRIYRAQIGGDGQNRPNEGMVKRALEQYKIVADKDPKDLESLVMVGALNRMLDNPADAEAAFKKALDVDPDNEDALVGLAGIAGERGDTKTSTQYLERLATKNPSSRAYSMLGSNYESSQEWALAAGAFGKAFELEPNQPEFQEEQAHDLAKAGQIDEAFKIYQKMADAKPLDATPYLKMGQIRQEQKRLEEAREYIDKAKQIDKFNLEVQRTDALLLAEEGKFPEAISAMQDVVDAISKRRTEPGEKSPRAELLGELGNLYRLNEQYDQAVENFKQMAAADPSEARAAAIAIIDCHRLAKDYAKADQEADAAIAKYPEDEEIRSTRAQLYSDEGKTDAAVAELRKIHPGKEDFGVDLMISGIYEHGKNFAEAAKSLDAAEKLAKDDKERIRVFYSRGELLERQKKFDVAEKEFRKALDLDGKNAGVLNYLGYMLADQNIRLPEAQDYIKRAVELEPGNYAYLDSLGWVYYRLNKLDEAERQLTRSLQLSAQKDPTIHDHMADVYFKQGKLKQAIQQWQASLKAYNASAPGDVEPEEMAKVQKKLDSARVKLAKEEGPGNKRN